ncbi:MAG: SDR family NAD(P)-dependent oxidoreductase [Planctomycetes bacterium]|nr:SDR family NAD(P)-dependent oxidoreductase [Planctomycetota bacterium]
MSDDGQAVLITGVSSRMRVPPAFRPARDGARAVPAAPRKDRLRQVADQVRQAGGEALVCVTDLTRPADIRAMIARTVETCGGIGVLYNSAGLMCTAPIEELSHKDIEQISTDMVKPQEVAELIVSVVSQPRHFNINEVFFRPTQHVF